jgi:hypothetical protein
MSREKRNIALTISLDLSSIFRSFAAKCSAGFT